VIRAISIGTLLGSDLRLHWSWPVVPAGVGAWLLAAAPWREASIHVLLLLAVYLCVLAHEAGQLLAARRFGLGTRDVTLYPLWGVARLTRLSDRPWQEIYIAASGPVLFAIIAAMIGALLAFDGTSVGFRWEISEPFTESFLVYLFWANVGLAAFHLLPVLPLDGGRALRAALAMNISRLRATEVVAGLSTLGTGCLLIVAFTWLRFPFAGIVAILIYLAAQDDLDTTRYFASLSDPPEDRPHSPLTPATFIPIDELLTPDCRPDEAGFTGFTWNARARLWIEWRDGRPVSANALLGDRHR
jgi:Zn-dependent protease